MRPLWGRTSVSTHPMRPHPGDLAMIITPEQAALKAQHQFDALRDFVQQAARDGQRIDTVEREVFRQLLGLGHTLLSAFVAAQGDGDLGPQAETPEGRTVRRLPERHDRRYVSIFGELTIARVAYGTREGQRIERVPLDERLGLPEGDFSYVLEDWGQRLCLKGSFAEAGQSLEMLLGLRVGVRALEQMNRVVAGHAPSFQDALEPPPAAEEGPLMVVTADGKGVPMRRPPQEDGPKPHHRRTKGEKANKKQMACVGAVYSIEPFVRKAEDIIDEVLRDKKAKERPRAAAQARLGRDDPGGRGRAAGDGQGGAVLPLDRRAGGPQPRARPPGDLPDGRRAGAVGRPGGVLPRGGGHPGPVPRAGAALGGGPLLPQGGERRGEGVRGAAAAGPAAGPGRVRDRRACGGG